MADKEPTGEDVPLEQCLDVAEQAHAAADDREEESIDWDGLIETPLSKVTEDGFRGQIGKPFEIELGNNDLIVNLESVDSDGDAPAECTAPNVRAPFTVTFQGEGERSVLPEGFYRMRNEALGEFEVHLEPIPAEGDGAWTPHLQAVFG